MQSVFWGAFQVLFKHFMRSSLAISPYLHYRTRLAAYLAAFELIAAFGLSHLSISDLVHFSLLQWLYLYFRQPVIRLAIKLLVLWYILRYKPIEKLDSFVV